MAFNTFGTGVSSGGSGTQVSGGGQQQGGGQTIAPTGDASSTRAAQLNAAGQKIYGDMWTPEMFNEAWSNYSTSGANPSDPQAYENQNFNRFMYTFQANPGAMGQASATAFTQMQQKKNDAQLASTMAPGSALYNQYFGDQGIVPQQFKAYQTGLQPQQDLAVKRLGETLASRGLSNSGAIQAGQEDINKDYSQILSQALQSMQGVGMQNLTNQAVSRQNYTQQQQQMGMSDVANSIARAQQQAEAQKYQQQMQQASGWSWLQPVATALGSLIPGVGAIAGPLLGAGAKALTPSSQYTQGGAQSMKFGDSSTFDPNESRRGELSPTAYNYGNYYIQ